MAAPRRDCGSYSEFARLLFYARRGIGMLGAERLLADRQRALAERPRPGEIALGPQQER